MSHTPCLESNLMRERAAAFEQCMDTACDEDNLVYAMVNAATLRPWTDDQLKQAGAEIWSSWAHDPSGCLTYEDTGMATGRYINFKILKHLAGQGDDQTLIDAEHVVGALLALSKEGDKVEDGFLPKPFGGLKKASQSKGISCDQCEHVLFALWRFRQIQPQSSLVPEIESTIVRMTEYFLRKNWSYLFHGLFWHCLEPTEHEGYSTSALIHSLGLYLPMCVMCHQITGEQKYIDELNQKLLPIYQRWLANPTERFTGQPNSCELLSMGLYFCWKNGYFVEQAAAGIRQCAALAGTFLSRDGLVYDLNGVTDDHQVEPHYKDEPLDACGDKQSLWVSNVKNATSLKLIHIYTLSRRVGNFEAEMAETILHVLNRFEKVSDVLWWIDLDGKQSPPEFRFMAETVSIVEMGAWLQTYYMMILPDEVDGL